MIRHDIAELERQLLEKKAALEHEKPEKEVFHEVVGENIQKHIPSFQPSASVNQAPTQQTVEPPSYLSQELKDKVQAMVNTVFAKSLEDGIKEAANSGNMAVIDAFHDILTDELYNQLIEKRKLDRVE